ncbi:MAG: hypothetical protein HPY59_11055 [Anaerolineae bacterium]|nr:hypothetical protein [Anaerolineae bacterium]
MKYTHKHLLIVCLVGILVSISCQISAGGPTPARTVSVSTQAVSELEEALGQVLDNPDPSGAITITLTEAQLTFLLEQQLSQLPEPLLQNPQILLQNERAEIFGVVQMNSITANTRLVLQVGVDQNGKLTATLISIDIGPLPAPQSLVEKISEVIDSTMQGSVSAMTSGLKIESVAIADGLMTITGTRQ